ncbi:YncE family protein [Nonomuraea sp. NPDC003201]
MRLSSSGRAPLSHRLAALAGSLLLAAVLLVAQAPAASAADTVTDLGVAADRGGDVVAQSGKIFVAADDRIVVTKSDGALIDTISGLSGAVALSVADNGRKVYAALRDSHEVIEIDIATLAITKRIDLTAYPCPSTLAQSYERLWVGYGCGQAGEGGVVALELWRPTPTLVPVGPGTTQPPLVAVAGSTLVAGEPGADPASIRVYDVSSTPATPRGEIRADTSLRDLALGDYGSAALSALADTHQFDAWDTTTNARTRAYDSGELSEHGLPTAVAASPNGAYVVGGWNSSAGDAAEIVVYDPATAEVIYSADHQGKALVAGSIAFYGVLTYAVLKEPDTGRMHLWRLPHSPYHASTLTMTAPSEATALKQLTFGGRLTLSTGALPGVQTLELYRWLPDGTSRPFQEVTTEADGTYQFTDTAPKWGSYEYRLYWPGNSWFRGSGASAIVEVGLYQPVLTVTGPTAGVVGERLEFNGTFAADGITFPPTIVTVVRNVSNPDGTTSKALAKMTAAADGSFSFADTPTTAGKHTYVIQLVGNSTIEPAKTTHVVVVSQPPA